MLSRRSLVCVASGSVALTNWILAEEGICGRSALAASLAPARKRQVVLRLDRKVCHWVAGMAYWLPGGLWRSE